MRVLVAESDLRMAASLARVLEGQGYRVDVASSGPDALALARALGSNYGAIVVEQLLPGLDAAELCAQLRMRGSWTPVLMLCSSGSVAQRAAGMEAGVDDYLVKPFAFDELLERVAALSRRAGLADSHEFMPLMAGDLRVDSRARRAWRGEVELELSSREFALLRLFVGNAGVALSRSEILKHVWHYEHQGGSNVVDQYVLYLRRKIDRPFRVRQLETVRGIGYRLHEQPIPMHRVQPPPSLV